MCQIWSSVDNQNLTDQILGNQLAGKFIANPGLIHSPVWHPEVLAAALNHLGSGVQHAYGNEGADSLSYLRRFPIDRLKIDQSFVRGIGHTPVNESIVRAIAALAHSLSLELIAEGTETEAELAVLQDCQCDEVQGYHFLRPSPAEDLAEWLRARSAESQSLRDGAEAGEAEAARAPDTALRFAAPLGAIP